MTEQPAPAAAVARDFKDLRPGDKFDLDRTYGSVTGVCVLAPVLIETRRRFLRKPIETYQARCVELHPFLGAVEWNPQESGDAQVHVYPSGRTASAEGDR